MIAGTLFETTRLHSSCAIPTIRGLRHASGAMRLMGARGVADHVSVVATMSMLSARAHGTNARGIWGRKPMWGDHLSVTAPHGLGERQQAY